jgi:mycothiol synthase
MSRYEVREPVPDDAPAVADAINRGERALHGTDAVTVEEVRKWWSLPGQEGNARVVVGAGGEIVGHGDVYDDSPELARFWLDFGVAPGHVEALRPLFASLEGRVRRLAEGRPQAPAQRTFVDDADREAQAVLAELGYRAMRHSFRMVVDLDEETPAPSWPDGIAVREYASGADEERVHALQMETFGDMWEFEPQSFEEWRLWMLDSRHDPALWFLAEAGDELVGIALCRPHEIGDPAMGWVSVLGVRKSWRRRGLATALLLHVFGEFRRRGRKRVGLGVDAESPTGAVALYERVGMHVARRQEVWEKSR